MKRFECVEDQRAAGFPVTEACEAAGVSTSGFYDWAQREEAGPSERQVADGQLVELMREIHRESDANYGPPLIGVGAAAVDFQVGTGRMPFQQPGTQAPRKQPVYSEEETAALAAYVASLGPGPAIPSERAYDTSDASVEEVARGAQFFLTNCTACHNFAAVGGALPNGRYAPSLLGVEAKYMYEAMLTGPQQMPVFSDETLSAEEKRGIIAYIEVLEDQPAYGGSDLGSLGPVTEGLWGWLIGVGSLVLAAVWIGNNGARAGKKR